VIDSKQHPVGVVTLTDVIRFVIKTRQASPAPPSAAGFSVTNTAENNAGELGHGGPMAKVMSMEDPGVAATKGLTYMLCVDESAASHRATTFLQRLLKPIDRVWVYTAFKPNEISTDMLMDDAWTAIPAVTTSPRSHVERIRANELVTRVWNDIRHGPNADKRAIGGHVGETDDIREGILNFADRNDIDVIVLGSRGLNLIRRMLLGSVSSHIVQHAKCPVMVVPPPAN